MSKKHSRERELDKEIVAALFDKGEHFVGESLPVSSDIRLKGRRFD
jgi:hypothetical protein